ncbi:MULTISPECIES: hypothetical protein [unclassified Xanthomonas]|uniref:hypothetical protein n=1 Tax=unclassified Xanthomonas TaxID=2643310 RepID=UPI002A82F490|nr:MULTISPECIES: hypothetical protein [unclassified Xanthomonas]MDY4296786.1 hypothetical protein [Xanthomonas sp. LF02-5]MDY4358455.1 hypothetical protein [Xanthomonas sp. LF04-12]
MRERPVLFNGPMVRGILDGRKTQTRRAVKPAPDPRVDWIRSDMTDVWRAGVKIGEVPKFGSWRCPFGQPGDRLWVRENGLEHRRARLFIHEATPGRWWTPEDGGRYGASYDSETTRESLLRDHKVRPSIHMPRWACRLVLEITDVRVERLQDGDGDTDFESRYLAEGINRIHHGDGAYYYNAFRADPHPKNYRHPDAAFRELWESTGGDWDSNPWVWVISFKRLEVCNGGG